jgi:hypothetical protein
MSVPQTNETILARHRLSIAIKEEHTAVPTESADEALHEAGGRLRVSPPDGDDHLDVDGAAQTTPGYRSLRLAWDTATFAERKLFLNWVEFNNATTDVPPETGDA